MSTPRFAQWRPHPWHGLAAGANPTERVNAFIEITPLYETLLREA
jgi:inorganic pyrophosphatase